MNIIVFLIVIVLVFVYILFKKGGDWTIDDANMKFKPIFWMMIVLLFLFASVLGSLISYSVLVAVYR